MQKEPLGIIGGSGLYNLYDFEEVSLSTPYGEPSGPYVKGLLNGEEVVFLARHGTQHSHPPHLVNYRANIHGFHMLGVKEIVAINAVGGINRNLKAGDLLLPHQAVDLTWGRESSFHGCNGEPVAHIDLTEPFCPRLRKEVLSIAQEAGIEMVDGGTYVCTQGPRLETAGEISLFESWGMDVVGMTLFPEVALARERGICYVTVAIVANLAAGISPEPLTVDEVKEAAQQAEERIKRLIENVVANRSGMRNCHCQKAIERAFF
jgi:5'-methylthioadenosine phosphorylase